MQPGDQENPFNRRNLPGARCWRRHLLVRCFFCVHGKRREASAPDTGGAALGEMGLWRSAGAVRCRAGHRKERSRRNPRGSEGASEFADARTRRHDVALLRRDAIVAAPAIAEAVRTLLSLGADPNYTNGKRDSFAMANAVHASAPVLRAMLEAGGNPNARNEFGEPMILKNWYLGYYPDQARSRLDLLLDHGADINSAMPESASDSAGYTLLLYRTKMGLDDKLAYADALALLERGADPNRAGADGMTFGKMLTEHRTHFGRTHKQPPAEFAALWDWAEKHGIIQQAQ